MAPDGPKACLNMHIRCFFTRLRSSPLMRGHLEWVLVDQAGQKVNSGCLLLAAKLEHSAKLVKPIRKFVKFWKQIFYNVLIFGGGSQCLAIKWTGHMTRRWPLKLQAHRHPTPTNGR